MRLLTIICDVTSLVPKNVCRALVEIIKEEVEILPKAVWKTVAKFKPNDWMAILLYVCRICVYTPVANVLKLICPVTTLNIEAILCTTKLVEID